MKSRKYYSQLTIILLLFVSAAYLSAQPGTGMNYQGVARDADGTILGGQELTVVVGIINMDDNNQLVWEEIHQVETNPNGMFSLRIGTDPETRSAGGVEMFSHIEWGTGEHALQVRMAVGDGEMMDLGLSPILSVPYAAHAMQVQQPFSRMTVNSEGQYLPEEPIFEVRNSDGLPVFAVYDTMVWVYANNYPDAKGMKGGFAVGGYKRANKASVDEEYMYVTPDGVNVYFNEDPVKGIKGGFAVGGYKRTKEAGNEYFRITPDSVRMFIRGSAENRRRAGFSIDGISPETGEKVTYLFMNPENYFIGENAGINTSGGQFNTLFGYHAGEYNVEGSANVMVGYESGLKNTAGFGNVFIGTQAGMNNEGGTENVYLGSRAGMNNVGSENVFLGSNAGVDNQGSGNVYLGSNAGRRNKGSNNVFIGNNAADAFQEASNVFVLENGTKDETRSLMVGNFANDLLRVNAFMGINAKPDSAYAINTNGTISVQEVAVNSDVRFKKNIASLQHALNVVTSLEGVSYEWDRESFPERYFDDKKHLGFIAQEVEAVIPELVSTDTRGYKAVNYQKVSTLLVEAMKEQQQMLVDRDKKICELEARIRSLEAAQEQQRMLPDRDEKIREMEAHLRRLEALVTGD